MWEQIIAAIISFLAGSGLFGLLGKRAKKIMQGYSESAAGGLERARKVLDDYQDGKISREEAQAQVQELEKLGGWIRQQMKPKKKSAAKSAKILLIVAPMLLFLAGCSTYRENIAPYIPAVSIGADIGGEGVGASVGFTSEWTGEKRERSLEVSPKVDE